MTKQASIIKTAADLLLKETQIKGFSYFQKGYSKTSHPHKSSKNTNFQTNNQSPLPSINPAHAAERSQLLSLHSFPPRSPRQESPRKRGERRRTKRRRRERRRRREGRRWARLIRATRRRAEERRSREASAACGLWEESKQN